MKFSIISTLLVSAALLTNASPMVKRDIGDECVTGSFECANGGVNQCQHGLWINIAVCPEGSTCMPNDWECVPNDRFEAVFSQVNHGSTTVFNVPESTTDCTDEVTSTVFNAPAPTVDTTTVCSKSSGHSCDEDCGCHDHTVYETCTVFSTLTSTETETGTVTDILTATETETGTITETDTLTATETNVVTATETSTIVNFTTFTISLLETTTETDTVTTTATVTETTAIPIEVTVTETETPLGLPAVTSTSTSTMMSTLTETCTETVTLGPVASNTSCEHGNCN